jgi:hypothetical protein
MNFLCVSGDVRPQPDYPASPVFERDSPEAADFKRLMVPLLELGCFWLKIVDWLYLWNERASGT